MVNVNELFDLAVDVVIFTFLRISHNFEQWLEHNKNLRKQLKDRKGSMGARRILPW